MKSNEIPSVDNQDFSEGGNAGRGLMWHLR